MDSRESFSSKNNLFNFPEHKPEVDGEVFPIFMPRGVRDIILDYYDNELKPIETVNKKKNIFKQYEQFKLFGRGLPYFINCEWLPSAANAILLGEENGIKIVLTIIEANPLLLRISTEGIDPLKRTVKGTLLQIAAMAGDVNLNPGIHDEKELGLVERLQIAGKLSNEEVRDQLEVITGCEAKQENEKRNQLVIMAMDKFMNRILQVKTYENEDFKKFKMRCKPFVVQLEKDLQFITNLKITSGYIFDPEVICKVAQEFESKVKSFGGWFSVHTGVFRVSGFGMLQKYLSVRDAEVAEIGMINYIEKHQIPPRELNPGRYDCSSGLGYDYYFDYDGNRNTAQKCQLVAPTNTQEMRVFATLVVNKNNSIAKFMESTNNKSIWRTFWGHISSAPLTN